MYAPTKSLVKTVALSMFERARRPIDQLNRHLLAMSAALAQLSQPVVERT
jgi:hypothetical protein